MPSLRDIAAVLATFAVVGAALWFGLQAMDAAPWSVQAPVAALGLGLSVIAFRHRGER